MKTVNEKKVHQSKNVQRKKNRVKQMLVLVVSDTFSGTYLPNRCEIVVYH